MNSEVTSCRKYQKDIFKTLKRQCILNKKKQNIRLLTDLKILTLFNMYMNGRHLR